MSFNIFCSGNNEYWWTNRIQLVTDTIHRENPDLLGVQEAHNDWMNALIAGLHEYDFVGVGRDDGKNEGERTAIFYKKDEFEILDSGDFWLSETPDVPSIGWDAVCKRVCTYAKLRRKTDGYAFLYINTHTDHMGKKAKAKGAALIAEKARALADDLPIYLSGDFNSTPDSKPIKILKEAGFFDTRDYAENGEPDYGDTWHAYGRFPTLLIDYIFTGQKETVKNFGRITTPTSPDAILPSDHYPVVAEF